MVDSHATARSLLASQLRALGVCQVLQSATAHDARQDMANLGVGVLLEECEVDNDILGRVLQADGKAHAAVSTIRNLLVDEPKYADADDVMGRIHAEQGDLTGAVAAC